MRVTRRFQFCAGHRVYRHESKCNHPHGHNYVLYATFEQVDGGLDSLGRVIDFSVIKEILGKWIDENWDHGFIYYDQDVEIETMFFDSEIKSTFKTYRMTANPTAENMAWHLLHVVCPMLFDNGEVKAVKMVLFETENCSAEVTL